MQVASDGKVVVTLRTYIVYVEWDGMRVAMELAKAKVQVRLGIAGS